MSSSFKYLSLPARECFITGALCASVNLAPHSSRTTRFTYSLVHIVFLRLSIFYSLDPENLGAWRVLDNIPDVSQHPDIVLSSHFCLTALAFSLSFPSCTMMRQLLRWDLLRLLACLLRPLALILQYLRASCISSVDSSDGFLAFLLLAFLLTLPLLMNLCTPCLSLST